MNSYELEDILKRQHVPDCCYLIERNGKDARNRPVYDRYVLTFENGMWNVSYEDDLDSMFYKAFADESEACDYLIKVLKMRWKDLF